MENIADVIKNICAFILVTTFINNLLYDSPYRKYIKFFSGVIVVVLLAEPVISVFAGDIDPSGSIKEYIENAYMDDGNDMLFLNDRLYEDVICRETENILEREGVDADKVRCRIGKENVIEHIYIRIIPGKDNNNDPERLVSLIADSFGISKKQVDIEF